MLDNRYAVTGESARLGPRVDVGSFLQGDSDDEVSELSRRIVGWRWSRSGLIGDSLVSGESCFRAESLTVDEWSSSCENGLHRLVPGRGPSDEQVSNDRDYFFPSFFLLSFFWSEAGKGFYIVTREG